MSGRMCAAPFFSPVRNEFFCSANSELPKKGSLLALCSAANVASQCLKQLCFSGRSRTLVRPT